MSGLVTLGETLVLLAAPESGPLRHARELRVGVGGAESNVAIGVRRLGGEATWIGRVGGDEFGELVLRTLRAEADRKSVRWERCSIRRTAGPQPRSVRRCPARLA